MKLLYVIPGLGRGGGAERAVAAMAPHLVRAGVELEVCILSDRLDLVQVIEDAGARVTRLSGTSSATAFTQLSDTIGERKPDLVHTTLFEADVIGRLAAVRHRVPVVSSLVSLAYSAQHYNDPAVRRLRLLAAQACDAASAVLVRRFHALTESVRTAMSRRLVVPRGKIDVIPRGRDPAALGRRSDSRLRETRRELGVPVDAQMILGLGRQEYSKGHDVLLAAFAALQKECPDAVLVLAGRRGALSPTLDRLIVELDLEDHVRYLGPRDDVGDLLAAADVFAMPSRREGFGSVLIEAMALEAPTVASDIPTIREVAGPDPWARLVAPDDSDAMARALLASLADDPADQRAAAGIARARFLGEFTIENVSRRMYDFYLGALRGRDDDRCG